MIAHEGAQIEYAGRPGKRNRCGYASRTSPRGGMPMRNVASAARTDPPAMIQKMSGRPCPVPPRSVSVPWTIPQNDGLRLLHRTAAGAALTRSSVGG
jgi:hypothetical protein